MTERDRTDELELPQGKRATDLPADPPRQQTSASLINWAESLSTPQQWAALHFAFAPGDWSAQTWRRVWLRLRLETAATELNWHPRPLQPGDAAQIRALGGDWENNTETDEASLTRHAQWLRRHLHKQAERRADLKADFGMASALRQLAGEDPTIYTTALLRRCMGMIPPLSTRLLRLSPAILARYEAESDGVLPHDENEIQIDLSFGAAQIAASQHEAALLISLAPEQFRQAVAAARVRISMVNPMPWLDELDCPLPTSRLELESAAQLEARPIFFCSEQQAVPARAGDWSPALLGCAVSSAVGGTEQNTELQWRSERWVTSESSENVQRKLRELQTRLRLLCSDPDTLNRELLEAREHVVTFERQQPVARRGSERGTA